MAKSEGKPEISMAAGRVAGFIEHETPLYCCDSRKEFLFTAETQSTQRGQVICLDRETAIQTKPSAERNEALQFRIQGYHFRLRPEWHGESASQFWTKKKGWYLEKSY